MYPTIAAKATAMAAATVRAIFDSAVFLIMRSPWNRERR